MALSQTGGLPMLASARLSAKAPQKNAPQKDWGVEIALLPFRWLWSTVVSWGKEHWIRSTAFLGMTAGLLYLQNTAAHGSLVYALRKEFTLAAAETFPPLGRVDWFDDFMMVGAPALVFGFAGLLFARQFKSTKLGRKDRPAASFIAQFGALGAIFLIGRELVNPALFETFYAPMLDKEDGPYRVSSHFSEARRDPVAGVKVRPHEGIDIAGAGGSPIDGDPLYSPTQATVVSITRGGGYGTCIILDVVDPTTKQNVLIRVAHLKDIAEGIKVGSVVGPGEQIGAVGDSGRVTGPHLHMEVLVKDPATGEMHAIDPRTDRATARMLARILGKKFEEVYKPADAPSPQAG